MIGVPAKGSSPQPRFSRRSSQHDLAESDQQKTSGGIVILPLTGHRPARQDVSFDCRFMAVPYGPRAPVAVLFAAAQRTRINSRLRDTNRKANVAAAVWPTRSDPSVTVLLAHVCHELVDQCPGI